MRFFFSVTVLPPVQKSICHVGFRPAFISLLLVRASFSLLSLARNLVWLTAGPFGAPFRRGRSSRFGQIWKRGPDCQGALRWRCRRLMKRTVPNFYLSERFTMIPMVVLHYPKLGGQWVRIYTLAKVPVPATSQYREHTGHSQSSNPKLSTPLPERRGCYPPLRRHSAPFPPALPQPRGSSACSADRQAIFPRNDPVHFSSHTLKKKYIYSFYMG